MTCVIENLDEMKAWSRRLPLEDRNLGFVPTMGYLHEGHLALVRESKKVCRQTVVSIFVNPMQFGPTEDYAHYPVDLERDRALLKELDVDVLFLPKKEDLYPGGFCTSVRVAGLTENLCGGSRPHFFEGVTTIVLKLFHLVQPDRAFFGEKDRQQLGVIRKMVRDLDMGITIEGRPTIREPDGIAMSSRNAYLAPEERQSARALYLALQSGKALIEKGERSADAVRTHMRSIIESHPRTRIDYVSVCDPERFTELERVEDSALLALAVHVGRARLIDNCLVENISCSASC